MDDFDKLREYLNEEKAGINSLVIKLIHEDAPKNKFSILAGNLRMIENVEAKMVSIERERKSQG